MYHKNSFVELYKCNETLAVHSVKELLPKL